MDSEEIVHPHITRMQTAEVSGDAAVMSMKGALKRFPTMDRETAEDTLRKQNTGLDSIGYASLSPEIRELIDKGEARIMGQDELKIPSIEVVSKETLPPIYGEDLSPFVYKLHAVEVHQYIPVDGVEKPDWMVKGQMPKSLGPSSHIQWKDESKTGPIAPVFSTLNQIDEYDHPATAPVSLNEEKVSTSPASKEKTETEKHKVKTHKDSKVKSTAKKTSAKSSSKTTSKK